MEIYREVSSGQLMSDVVQKGELLDQPRNDPRHNEVARLTPRAAQGVEETESSLEWEEVKAKAKNKIFRTTLGREDRWGFWF